MKRFVETSHSLLLIGIISIAYILIYNCFHGGFYAESPDGTLYLSVAQNFISTGHFIQTARPYEIEMIVPFGLPLIFSLIYGITRNIYGILFVQYLLYGICGGYIFKIGYCLSKNVIIGLIGWIVFLTNKLILAEGNPHYLLTEAWTIPLITLFIYYYLIEKRPVVCLLLGYFIWIIRPLYWPLFLLSIVKCITRANSHNIGKYIGIFGFMAGLLFINVASNYRETKEFICFENYTGIALYQANNPSTKTTGYYSEKAKEFVAPSDTFWDIYHSQISESEKNRLYIQMATEWIMSHKVEFLENTFKKFNTMYLRKPLIFIVEFLYLIIAGFATNNRSIILLWIAFFLIALQTSIGLAMSRYTIFTIPFFVLSAMGILTTLYEFLQKKKAGNS